MTFEDYFKTKTTKQLIQEQQELDNVIYNLECFNSRDIALLEAIQQELYNRKLKGGSK